MCQVILEKHTEYLTVILQGELILGCTSEVKEKVRDDVLDMLIDFVQDENHSVLVSSHITSDLEKVADYIVFIHQGKVIFCGFTDYVRKIVGYAKLDKIFTIADTRAKAEELLRG